MTLSKPASHSRFAFLAECAIFLDPGFEKSATNERLHLSWSRSIVRESEHTYGKGLLKALYARVRTLEKRRDLMTVLRGR